MVTVGNSMMHDSDGHSTRLPTIQLCPKMVTISLFLHALKIDQLHCAVGISILRYNIIVQFPNSVPVIVNLDLTLNFVTLIGQPQYNGRFCWQASLLHLRPSFSSTRMITRTIYVQDLSSGTVLKLTIS